MESGIVKREMIVKNIFLLLFDFQLSEDMYVRLNLTNLIYTGWLHYDFCHCTMAEVEKTGRKSGSFSNVYFCFLKKL